MAREIRELKQRLDQVESGHARLEERIDSQAKQVEQLPDVPDSCRAGIREALSAVLAGARRTA